MRGRQSIARGGYAVVSAVAAALLAVACSADDGSVHRVVGAGTSCEAQACSSGSATYSLRLAAPDELPAGGRFFDLAEDAPHHESVSDYPECVSVRLDGDVIESWKPTGCP